MSVPNLLSLKKNTAAPPDQPTNNVTDNMYAVLLYALCLVTALGFNDLVLSIFSHFSKTSSKFIAKIIYVIIMFFITILIAYLVNSSLKN